MFERTSIEFLEESRDSWRQSANADRRYSFLSFAFSGVGLALLAKGTETLLSGDTAGGLEVGIGLLTAVCFGMIGKAEVQDYTNEKALVEQRQSQIDMQLNQQRY